MLRLLEQLEAHAHNRPNVTAILTPDPGATRINWKTLHATVVRFAGHLTSLTQPGDILLLCSPNRIEFVVTLLAALHAGLRVFPVSPTLTAAELRAAATATAASVLVGTTGSLSILEGLVPTCLPIEGAGRQGEGNSSARDSENAALLLHSSGTTGEPKIVLRSARSLDAVSAAMVGAIQFRPADRVLACVPLCHSYGLEHGLLAPIFAGAAVHLCHGFDLPTILHELDDGVTILPGVPFIYETLARQAGGRRYPALRRAYSAGGPLPASVASACLERLDLVVSQLYGATEIGSVTYADPEAVAFAPSSVGRAMQGVDIRILDCDAIQGPTDSAGAEGEIAIRADSMFSGYFDGSAAPLLDDYFRTGDLGRLDAAGNLTLTGRLKLLIDVAGLKVNPMEVESTLAHHPGVALCVVVAVAVSETVSRLKAIVVAREPGAAAPEALRQFLRARLAPHKIPRMFEFRDSLPQSASGKVLRQQVIV